MTEKNRHYKRIMTDRGVTFNVRMVYRHHLYGLNDCLVHEEDEPLVEFYDARWAWEKGFGCDGQFVARYYATTLLERDQNYGLALYGRERDWVVDAKTMAEVLEWIEGNVKREWIKENMKGVTK